MIKAKFLKKLIASLAFFLFVILTASLLPHFRNSSLDAFVFPLKIFAWINRQIGAIIFYHRNFTENIKLKKEVGLLQQNLNQARELYLENQRLKELLAFKQNSPYRLVACRVIGRDPSSWTCVIIIDKGRKSGLKPDMAVITEAGLVGKIIEAGESTSRAMLLNDPNMSVSAIIQRSRQEGLVCGSWHSNTLTMRYLSADADIKVGDIIVTSGLSPIYPKGLLIGTVKEVGVEFSGLSLYAMVKPRFELGALEEVLVIIK